MGGSRSAVLDDYGGGVSSTWRFCVFVEFGRRCSTVMAVEYRRRICCGSLVWKVLVESLFWNLALEFILEFSFGAELGNLAVRAGGTPKSDTSLGNPSDERASLRA